MLDNCPNRLTFSPSPAYACAMPLQHDAPFVQLPELLAPAGDSTALQAALHAGADAVYFGLSEGLNARARTANFALDNLPATCAQVHLAGAKAYLTLNTLVFELELPVVAAMIAAAANAGVDALIVQDPAVALLAQAIAPTLQVHASTQMTISSPEAARFAQRLGVTRVVVPRELSVAQIGQFAAGTTLELEVFIHGALCVSWSGQCLTSEAWGGRSANRGQCAQSCRMPYTLVVDGAEHPTADLRYLLSPLDLAGLAQVPELAALGVHGLKIEGRQKGPHYVATAVQGYRQQLDRLATGQQLGSGELATELTSMALAFSRGFSTGFLTGGDHQHLVEGRFPKHRGVLLGVVAQVAFQGVRVVRAQRYAEPGLELAPVEPMAGMGVGFDLGRPETAEPGGAIYGVEPTADGYWLRFATSQDLTGVHVGHRVWLTQDPQRQRGTERILQAGAPTGRIAVAIAVSGQEGTPLTVQFSAQGAAGRGQSVTVQSQSALQLAVGVGLAEPGLRDKLATLGGTPFRLGVLDAAALQPGLHLPVSELKQLRRTAVTQLEALVLAAAHHAVVPGDPVVRVSSTLADVAPAVADVAPLLVPLVRNDAQLDAVIASGLPEVVLDWMDLVGLTRAVDKARAAGLQVTLATVRVQKPGEDGFDRRFGRLQPDGVLVRHWGALEHFAALPSSARPRIHGDFSLNVTNSLTARHLFALGASSLCAAHDLDHSQLQHLLTKLPAQRIEVVLHQHIATFHTEHCVYAHQLSQGRDYLTCGRPCEQHSLGLRDHLGLVHPVVVDVGCRNTVFNAKAQTAAQLVPGLLGQGVRRFRAEFVWETADQVAQVLDAYQALLAGKAEAVATVGAVGAHEQFGVTSGTLRTLAAA